MSKLEAWKDTGELLFNTDLICYGLVKSGYLVADEVWPRKYLRSNNLDPNQGGNWTDSFRAGDQMHSVTVQNAQSPIVFIVGKGCLQGTVRTGNTVKFLYSAASTNTRAYVFDLMLDIFAGSTFLKTYTNTGVLTFNSLQPPLNVIAAIQAPAPSGLDQYGRRVSAYAGGTWTFIRGQTAAVDSQAHHTIDVSLVAGVEYAAFLPWSRAATGFLGQALTGVVGTAYGMSEGCYGRTGGISFIFGPAGATTVTYLTGNAYSLPGSFQNLPVDRYPTALVISTANLIFPYN